MSVFSDFDLRSATQFWLRGGERFSGKVYRVSETLVKIGWAQSEHQREALLAREEIVAVARDVPRSYKIPEE